MSDISKLSDKLKGLTEQIVELTKETDALQLKLAHTSALDPFVFGMFVFVLACFVGYYVVWKVTPALHTPLMAVTNAISGIIIVGAMIAVGANSSGFSTFLGFLAVILASINIFGGFVVTQRMLEMFKKKERK